jgi:hypothetical protein
VSGYDVDCTVGAKKGCVRPWIRKRDLNRYLESIELGELVSTVVLKREAAKVQ